jgi:hypothetical protein
MWDVWCRKLWINSHILFAPTFGSGNNDSQYVEGFSPIIQCAEIYPVCSIDKSCHDSYITTFVIMPFLPSWKRSQNNFTTFN